MRHTLCSLVLMLAACSVNGEDSALDHLHKTSDTSTFVLYNATEECKKTDLPCFTNLKYCDNSTDGSPLQRCPDNLKKDDLSWMHQDEDIAWVKIREEPALLLGGAYDPYNSLIVLKWTNTDPKYPTTISWRPVDFTSQFYMYTVVEPGKTEWNFTIGNLDEEMLPGVFVPSNVSWSEPEQYMLKKDLHNAVAAAYPIYFAIGQPEKHGGLDPNRSDTTSVFLYTDAVKSQLYDLGADVAGYSPSSQSNMDKKWQAAFGVGFGMGMPLVSALMFWLGQRSGLKHSMAPKEIE